MFTFSFIKNSTNSKVGPMPVTRTSKNSCPSTCPLLNNGCYASSGHSNIHWNKLNHSGLTFSQLLANIKKLAIGQIWRMNESGDLPHIGDNATICRDSLQKIVVANNRKKGFTYTHYPLNQENIQTLQYANQNGFTVNVSANNLTELDHAINHGLPAVVIVDDSTPNKFKTNNGNNVIVCPNQLKNSIQCIDCGLCAKSNRNFSIAFKAHGIGKKKVLQAIAQ